jgi:CDP-6-deoxy-D-xylo-4-hexulose-3-dehydrase
MEDKIVSKASNFEKRILFAKPVHGKEEIDAVMESLKSGWLGPGEITIKFEKKFNSMIGKKYGVLLNSGSSANLLSVLSLCLPPGSEIITPACTFPTTLNPILQSGCIPVVGDVELNTYNIDISKVEELISSKTRAIIAPHALGSPLDTYKLREICNHHQLKLIEDSCDTVGTKINDHYTGYYGDVGTFSFYASHHLTLGGGGGMIVTDNEEIVKHIKSYKDWGRADEFQKYWTNEGEDFHRRFTHEVDNIFYDSKYTYNHIGYNFKMVEMQAAFGLAQLAKLQEFNKIRDRNVKQLAGFLSDYQDLFILPSYPKHTYPSYLAYPITLQDNAPFARYELLEYLENNGIQTRLLFAGNILRHDAYKNIQYRKAESLANSDKIMRDTFLVGIHQGISEEDMDYMCEIFLGFLKS